MARHKAPSSRIKVRNRRNRKNIQRKTGAKAQQKQLLAVNKNIALLNQAVGLTKQHAQYSQNLSTQIGYNCLNGPLGNFAEATNAKGWNIQELIAPGNAVVPGPNGTRWAGWSPIFQATNEVENANKFFLEKLYMKMHFNLDKPNYSTQINDYTTRPSYPYDITCFIVSFKPDAWPQAQKDFFDADRYWDPSVWNAQNDAQYWTTSPKRYRGQDALPMLNPAVFNIHYYKTLTIGQTTGFSQVTPVPTLPNNPNHSLDAARAVSLVTNISDVQKNITKTLPLGKLIKSTTGDTKWKQLQANELEHHERRWLIFHVSGDSEASGTAPGKQAKIGVTCNFQYSGKGTN